MQNSKKKMPLWAALAVGEFFARGGQVTVCPPRRAHNRSDGGWARINDEARRERGKAFG